MAVTLMTTTGTLEDVNAALGIAAGSMPSDTEPGPISATVDAAPVATPPAEEPKAEPETPLATAETPSTPVTEEHVPDEEFDEDGEPTTERAARSSRTKLQTIKKLRIRAREAELRAARAEGELEARRTFTTPTAAVPEPPKLESQEPKEADFDTYEAFIEARADFRARRAYREEREAERAADAQRQQQTAQQQQRQAVMERIKAFEADHPDYADVVSNPELILTEPIAVTLQEAEDGPALAYALAKDPARFKQIAAMSPVRAIKALGELSAELRQVQPKAEPVAPPKLPAAPPPPTPVRGASVAASVSLEDFAKTIQPGSEQTSEWLRRRNEQIARRAQR